MPTKELELTIEIDCIELPGLQCGGRGPVHLGIQKGDEVIASVPADRKHAVFKPVFRVRRQVNGSVNFLGPFAHGPASGRFVYLSWFYLQPDGQREQFGRAKVLLGHLEWSQVEQSIARRRPIKATIGMSDAKGKPRCASIRDDVARWDL